jgi:hypothetical protein
MLLNGLGMMKSEQALQLFAIFARSASTDDMGSQATRVPSKPAINKARHTMVT